MPTLTHDLATAVVDVEVPASARAAAARSLLDAIGVSQAATALGEGTEAFLRVVGEDGGAPKATAFGISRRVPPSAAALVNGALAHALDFEDAVDGLAAHPNAQVIPVVLALAEDRGSSGRELLEAIAIGCEVTCRIAGLAGDGLAQAGWYPPPAVGAIGAACAAARLLRFSPATTVDAISLTLAQVAVSNEVKYSPRSHLRGVRDAFAAQGAVRGAQLAEAGVRGTERPLEGPAGFLVVMAGLPEGVGSELLVGFGQGWWAESVSFKPWPSCRGTHSFIQAALKLRENLRDSEVASVQLNGAPVNRMLAEPRETKISPKTGIDAKFSLPYTVAAALVDGNVGLDTFFPESLSRQTLHKIASKVEFVPDLEWATPDRMTSGRMRLTTEDGSSYEVQIDTPRGAASDPLSDDEVIKKFVENCSYSVRPPRDPEAFAADLLKIDASDSVVEVLSRHLGAVHALEGSSSK